jgi:hypothetical protein
MNNDKWFAIIVVIILNGIIVVDPSLSWLVQVFVRFVFSLLVFYGVYEPLRNMK